MSHEASLDAGRVDDSKGADPEFNISTRHGAGLEVRVLMVPGCITRCHLSTSELLGWRGVDGGGGGGGLLSLLLFFFFFRFEQTESPGLVRQHVVGIT